MPGVAVVYYFREERARLERKQIAEQAKGIGKPKVGGPFNLIDHNGRPFTSEDLKGKYSLVRKTLFKQAGASIAKILTDVFTRSTLDALPAQTSGRTSSTRWPT